jgi:hypothetical protein
MQSQRFQLYLVNIHPAGGSVLTMVRSESFVNALVWRLKALGAPKVHLICVTCLYAYMLIPNAPVQSKMLHFAPVAGANICGPSDDMD